MSLKKQTARAFIRPIATVWRAVTKEFSSNAHNGGLRPARELPSVTELLRVADSWESSPCCGFLVAVVNKLPPVATLLLNVKSKTRGAPNGLKALPG